MKIAELDSRTGVTGVVDGHEVAVFSENNQLIVLENVCPHMGCQTNWNEAELTWDCPCHGSRFKQDGEVLTGPSKKPMQALKHEILDGEIHLVD